LEGVGEINGCLFWTSNSVCVCVGVRLVIKAGGRVCPFESNIKMCSFISQNIWNVSRLKEI